jgi:hypothetical protein
MKFIKKNLLDILCWLLLVAGVFAIYVITIENDFTSSVERGRYALTRAIVEDHSLKIDNYKDFSFPDVSFKNGHYYSRFPGGMSFLMAPAHMVALKLSPQSPQIFGFEFVSFLSALSIGFLYILGRVNKFSISTSLLGSYVFPASDKYKSELLNNGYISQIPKDPKTDKDYEYKVGEQFDTFTLKTILDNAPEGTTGYLCNQEECRNY